MSNPETSPQLRGIQERSEDEAPHFVWPLPARHPVAPVTRCGQPGPGRDADSARSPSIQYCLATNGVGSSASAGTATAISPTTATKDGVDGIYTVWQFTNGNGNCIRRTA